MDTHTPAPQPDPRQETRQIVWGVIITLLVILVATALFTLMLMKSGGRGNYYNDMMERGERRQAK
jgi:hypothetical protein